MLLAVPEGDCWEAGLRRNENLFSNRWEGSWTCCQLSWSRCPSTNSHLVGQSVLLQANEWVGSASLARTWPCSRPHLEGPGTWSNALLLLSWNSSVWPQAPLIVQLPANSSFTGDDLCSSALFNAGFCQGAKDKFALQVCVLAKIVFVF